DDLLKSVAPIRRELDRVGASSYATNSLLSGTDCRKSHECRLRHCHAVAGCR
ncbi:unnamed protein product, partial [Ascophyllum nodosum]